MKQRLSNLETKRGSYTSENIIINCCKQEHLKNDSMIIESKTEDQIKRRLVQEERIGQRDSLDKKL